MASSTTAFGSGVSTTALGLSSLKPSPTVGVATIIFPKPRRSSAMVVRVEGQTINPEIRKTEEKVVDSVVVTELSKPLTAYCRCWRSVMNQAHHSRNKSRGSSNNSAQRFAYIDPPTSTLILRKQPHPPASELVPPMTALTLYPILISTISVEDNAPTRRKSTFKLSSYA
ncbi:hypothetical protein GOBAR_AA28214 [Gossypium barbadense]|uniref:Uncharacterized protein n=1 Tax=Gossypium barbadense TaxID=3634 RepID=A0A2P5WMX9_GOSBA|nr:hypothetical protein GOBAR_AA28214 [Gossypium barbadense]